MKKIALAITFFTILFLKTSTGFSQEKEHKIVFHLASSDTLVHKALVKQVANVLEYWKTAKIEVVVHNNGIGFMKLEETKTGKEINSLAEKGVVFAVCENTMKQRKLEKKQILSSASYVPVGIAELVLKQEAGYAYIKAGF